MTAESQITISIVCPCYNEEQVVALFLDKLTPILEATHETYEVICINDGSRDQTLDKLIEAKKHYPALQILNLSRNFGKEAAMTAGLDHARGEVIIPIDADLQDPPELIKDFIREWKNGYDVVTCQTR